MCHVHGIAVIFDVVYNHAGGGFDDHSMWFFDRAPNGNINNSLYFTDQGMGRRTGLRLLEQRRAAIS